MTHIEKFFRSRHPFSQWYPCVFFYDNTEYCCAEQAMMHQKARLMGDAKTAEEIMKTSDPKKIKQLGRQVLNFDSKLWDKNKENIVCAINMAKFGQNKDIKECLLNTESRTIAEASPYDRIWGIGLSETDPRSDNPELWLGKNLLGKALMRVRDDLKSS